MLITLNNGLHYYLAICVNVHTMRYDCVHPLTLSCSPLTSADPLLPNKSLSTVMSTFGVHGGSPNDFLPTLNLLAVSNKNCSQY